MTFDYQDDLPDTWTLATIGELLGPEGVFTDGDWIETKDQDPDGGVRLVQLADIGDGEFVDKSNRFLTDAKAQELKCTFLRRGDVLVARMPDPLGRACIFPLDGDKRFVTAVDVCVIRPANEFVDPKFLMNALNSPSARVEIDSYKSGSTRRRISRKNLGKVQIPVAPLQEQRRVVAKTEELFSELDNGIANLKTARQQLSTYRQALLKHAFEGKLTTQWREASAKHIPSGQEFLRKIERERSARYDRRLKQWEANESLQNERRSARKPRKLPLTALPIAGHAPGSSSLPSRWTLVRVQDVLRERPANGRSVKDRESGFPVLRLTAIGDDGIDLSECKEGDWEREDARPYIVKEGDFLLARGNGSRRLVGRGGLVSESQYDVAYPDTMIRLRVEPEVIDSRFFSLVWNSRFVRRQIEAAAHTTAGIYKINQTHILHFILPICSLEEQSKIVQMLEERLSKVRAVEREIDDQLVRSEALRQAILKEAFSGQLVPQDPADEPASVPLERIQAERSTSSNNPKRKAGT